MRLINSNGSEHRLKSNGTLKRLIRRRFDVMPHKDVKSFRGAA